MKVYFIYVRIDRNIFTDMIKKVITNAIEYVYNESLGLYTGLYAWTTEKKLLDRFLSERSGNKNYIVRKKDIDKERFGYFSVDYKELKLGKYNFKNMNDEKIELVATFNEHNQVTEESSENLYDVLPILNTDYTWFNDEIIDALDELSYTSIYDNNPGEDSYLFEYEEIVSRMDIASYQRSYGLTIIGNKFIDFTSFSLYLLFYLYSEMFVSKLNYTKIGVVEDI